NKEIISYIQVLRDEKWQKIDSRELVPEDIIKLSVGDIAPADCEIVEQSNLSLNESALTGESLPVEKKVGEKIFSGSFLTTGQCTAQVTFTGIHTYLAKSLKVGENSKRRSLLEKDILVIAKYLTVISIASAVIVSIFFLAKQKPVDELLTLNLSIIIAGIPISLTTVMTLIIEFGAINLFNKRVIVRRLSALEELSNVNLLLTDKTGTLTKNEINIHEIKTYQGTSADYVLQLVCIAAQRDPENPINKAIIRRLQDGGIEQLDANLLNFIPADSDRKHSTLTAKISGQQLTIAIGAPQVVQKLTAGTGGADQFLQDVADFAAKGYRTIAVATMPGERETEGMQMTGLIALSDTLREDAPEVLEFLRQNHIATVMVTGDNYLIAQEIATKLGLQGKVMKKSELPEDMKLAKEDYMSIAAFAEVLPTDKFKLVQNAEKYYVVSANGDGVNDIPAIQAANVGMAVASAVSSLKSAADIVLLTDGIAVIKDAIIESRKIFARLFTYAQYRISESLRLIITILLLGLLVGDYPLTPLQIILLALLNDIPIISLAFDRVKVAHRPEMLNVKRRFMISSVWGLIGVMNSLGLFVLTRYIMNLDWGIVQTMFFLKLTVSGHLLIYVTRTRERWYRYLPSKAVVLATMGTQLLASIFAFTGFLMPAAITAPLVLLVWGWSFVWMQVSELAKTFFWNA
ncbi:HAD-IC family P-type ATPase, partial [Candidatus Dojkabacteria bacterium]|nr:HAD-IC family P-type ATPase [Candidatus Dojkabacteria bacterium]